MAELSRTESILMVREVAALERISSLEQALSPELIAVVDITPPVKPISAVELVLPADVEDISPAKGLANGEIVEEDWVSKTELSEPSAGRDRGKEEWK